VASGLRIGYLVQQFLPEVGAGPARVSEMALQWRDAGARVTVITGMPNRPQGRIYDGYRGRLFMEEHWSGIRVLRSWLFATRRHGFGGTLLNNVSFMLSSAIHALLRARPIDVLIASSPPFFPHVAGSVFHRVTGIPLVLELRDLWPDYVADMGTVKSPRVLRALFALERRLLRDASRVVVVTESFRRRVAAKGVPAELIDVISNGVDDALYYPAAEPPPLAELERRNGEHVIGYLGNIGVGQGLDAVVDAAAILEQQNARVRFVVVGDGPERAALERRVESLGLRSFAIRPPIAKAATRAFYNACDVCLVPLASFPILQETVPSKLFEVMACERPLIASVAGEAANIAEDSAGAWVAPPGDGAALAEVLSRMLALPDSERRALGVRAGIYVRRHFARRRLAERYLEILTTAATSPPIRRRAVPTAEP
jgi:glycosyltransferase involved in cell wall biosynthesis